MPPSSSSNSRLPPSSNHHKTHHQQQQQQTHHHGAPVFSSAGRELLLELKRSTGNNKNKNNHQLLPPYNTKLTRACFQDLRDSVQQVQDIIQAHHLDHPNNDNDDESNSKKPPMSVRPSILFHHASIQRHKRCLLAYHKHRMDQLKQKQYANATTTTTTTTGNSSGGGTNGPVLTNAAEAEFAQAYHELRASYAESLDIELDVLPPTSHMVQVRVLQNNPIGGPVVLDSGRAVTLTKGSSLYMQRSDALEFLQAGILELMDGEEVDF